MKSRNCRDFFFVLTCWDKEIKLIQIPYWVAKTNETLIVFIKTIFKELGIAFEDKDVVFDESIYKSKLKKLQKAAESKGGKCLSTVFNGINEKHDFICKNGHSWGATGAGILHRGTWCAKCFGNNRLTIEEMHKIAESRGGLCLSNEYMNTKTKLTWQCKEKHEPWDTTPDNIRDGSWCPECRKLGIVGKFAKKTRNRIYKNSY